MLAKLCHIYSFILDIIYCIIYIPTVIAGTGKIVCYNSVWANTYSVAYMKYEITTHTRFCVCHELLQLYTSKSVQIVHIVDGFHACLWSSVLAFLSYLMYDTKLGCYLIKMSGGVNVEPLFITHAFMNNVP